MIKSLDLCKIADKIKPYIKPMMAGNDECLIHAVLSEGGVKFDVRL